MSALGRLLLMGSVGTMVFALLLMLRDAMLGAYEIDTLLYALPFR